MLIDDLKDDIVLVDNYKKYYRILHSRCYINSKTPLVNYSMLNIIKTAKNEIVACSSKPKNIVIGDYLYSCTLYTDKPLSDEDFLVIYRSMKTVAIKPLSYFINGNYSIISLNIIDIFEGMCYINERLVDISNDLDNLNTKLEQLTYK